jgi:hypothetical protein
MGFWVGLFGKSRDKGVHVERNPPESFVVYSDDTNPQNSRKFPSWNEAVAFAKNLAMQSPESYVTLHRYPNAERVHYRVNANGEVERIDLRQQGFE